MLKPTSSAEHFGAELSPGLRVGGARYLLKRLIGRGEVSELWLARDIKNVRDVALRFLPKSFLQDANLLESVRQEIRRETLLKHPHIVSIHELALDHASAAIAMEFVDGWSLATLKVDKPDRRHRLEEIEPWIRDVCDALAYAHNEFGIIHGDLKPSNLLLSGRDGIKVSDFGFAAHIRNEGSKRGIIKSGYAGIGFLSPQQVMGETAVKADDIYSLGATIFDLITGTAPFYKGEVVAQICSLTPPQMAKRLSELGVECEPIPAVWEVAVAACLAKNPSDRPRSVQELLRLLDRPEPAFGGNHFASADESLSAAPVKDQESADEADATGGRSSQSLIPLGLVTAFVAVLLLAAFWFGRRGKFVSILDAGRIGLSAGSLDNSFDAGTGADDAIWCAATLPDGKMFIGGVFMNYDGIAAAKMARLLANGTLDKTFAARLTGSISDIVPLENGKVLAAGLGLIAGHPARKLVRLNADGSFDHSFDGGTYNRAIVALAVQAGGKVLVGGRFTNVSGKRHWGILRLTANGEIDNSFDVGSGPSAAVLGVKVQPDGKILAAGEFKTFNGQDAGHLVRLNEDGSVDGGFNVGTGADQLVWSLRLQNDGKILIAGTFNRVNGISCPHIARLNADGSVDSNFHAPDGLGNDLQSMTVQPDGKILVGGTATVNGATRPVLVRLNANGTLDKSFQLTSATGNTIWHISLQPGDKIVVAGRFNSLDGVLCGNIARLQD
ncbi:MAG TPA: protein kinase [Verrucomicrobiae bacterium]|nr:protein kinase [Verrucomicrobiae bacterium]